MKNILRNTLAILDKKEKKQLGVLVTLDIVISILDILSLVLLLWIIQFYIQPGHSNRLSFLPGWLADKNSVLFIAIFFFLFGAKNMAAFFIARAWYRFVGRVAIRISRNNLLNYQQAGFDEFVNIDSSVQIRKIALQPFEFCQYILSGIQQIITQVFLIGVAIIAILLFNAKLFLLLFCILLPPAIAVFYLMKKRLIRVRNHIRSSNQRSYQYMLDALKGYVESNIYNRNDFFMQRFIRYREEFSKNLFESISLQNMPSRVIEIFAILGLFILIAIAKWSGNNDNTALITVGAFMAAAYKIIPGIVKVINVSGQMKAYEFSVSDMAETIKPTGTENEKKGPAGIRSLEIKNISFQYANLPVLDRFSLQLQKGDFACITGESGRGKTTIFNLLLGFLSPQSGEIFMDDRPVHAEDIKTYWPLIAYVKQQSFLIHDTILRNITLQEEEHDPEGLQKAVKTAGLDTFLTQFPEGLNKVITENGKNISGGQQQRIAIARALYKNADLVLLDEPFNELDEDSTIRLLEHFRELSKNGKMIILVTHDKKSPSYCNKIISLDEA